MNIVSFATTDSATIIISNSDTRKTIIKVKDRWQQQRRDGETCVVCACRRPLLGRGGLQRTTQPRPLVILASRASYLPRRKSHGTSPITFLSTSCYLFHMNTFTYHRRSYPLLTYLATSGRRVSTAVTPTALIPICKFMLFVLRRRAPAIESSSILWRPEPSTSQSPPWATFHNPCFPLSMNPKDNAKGK